MKTSLILILSVALFFGCKSGTNNTDSNAANMGVTENNDANNVWDQDKIKEFVDEAAAGSMMDVELGKSAQTRAMDQQVKDYAKMMEKNHSDASDKLKTAIQGLGLNVPASLDQEHQDKITDLNKKTGNDFDKDYIDKMVQDHKEDVGDFEEAQKNLPSGELKTWVENTLPVLRQHQIQAETIQEQLKNKK